MRASFFAKILVTTLLFLQSFQKAASGKNNSRVKEKTKNHQVDSNLKVNFKELGLNKVMIALEVLSPLTFDELVSCKIEYKIVDSSKQFLSESFSKPNSDLTIRNLNDSDIYEFIPICSRSDNTVIVGLKSSKKIPFSVDQARLDFEDNKTFIYNLLYEDNTLPTECIVFVTDDIVVKDNYVELSCRNQISLGRSRSGTTSQPKIRRIDTKCNCVRSTVVLDEQLPPNSSIYIADFDKQPIYGPIKLEDFKLVYIPTNNAGNITDSTNTTIMPTVGTSNGEQTSSGDTTAAEQITTDDTTTRKTIVNTTDDATASENITDVITTDDVTTHKTIANTTDDIKTDIANRITTINSSDTTTGAIDGGDIGEVGMEEGLNGGEIAAIIIGVVVGVGLIGACAYFIHNRNNPKLHIYS